MSDAWNCAERCRDLAELSRPGRAVATWQSCRDLAEECRQVAALCSSTQMRNHHLQMEEHYNTLAQAEELAALAHALGD